jgi:hypothetical protein
MPQLTNFVALERCTTNSMKPQSQISRQLRSHDREEMAAGMRLKHPVIDFHYQPTGTDFRAANHHVRPSEAAAFRDLSKTFLGAEMRRDFVAEAVCFLIIVSISAWPIVSMVRALSLLK